jgi:hypothetical protein
MTGDVSNYYVSERTLLKSIYAKQDQIIFCNAKKQNVSDDDGPNKRPKYYS